MGTIGQKLPKVLWPVFEKSLLELQVGYARSLGAKKIYINLHYMGEEIENFCKSKSAFEDVIFLWEKPIILDIGGAIHNLASLPDIKYSGKLLVLNADQFFYIKKDELEKIVAPFIKSPGVLFSYFVNSTQGYNALELNAKRELKGITQNKDLPKDSVIETYSVNSNHPFLRFLVNERAMKTWKIDLLKFSYNSKTPRVINLAEDVYSQETHPAIFLSSSSAKKINANMIWWKDLSEEVK
jgi:bifunctional N-acetylglucosamine-1-phosphate-uridyltransferase/glucosamine-1-phosphate-acetyltransferase GlmU-like protein